MTTRKRVTTGIAGHFSSSAIRATLSATMLALAITACRPGDEPGTHVAGWTMIDPAQRHPIIVSHQPSTLTLRVARGSAGMTPQQRANVVEFLSQYRGTTQGNGRLSIGVPSGAPNEVATLQALADLKDLLRDFGLEQSQFTIQAYHSEGERQPPIRVSFARYVAEAPLCAQWPANLAEDARNLPYHNMGCSSQRNIAAQIANPADLLGPRPMGPNSAERRDAAWEKWTKGESTVSAKSADERAKSDSK
jgi:pilus assembly protein CpaD